MKRSALFLVLSLIAIWMLLPVVEPVNAHSVNNQQFAVSASRIPGATTSFDGNGAPPPPFPRLGFDGGSAPPPPFPNLALDGNGAPPPPFPGRGSTAGRHLLRLFPIWHSTVVARRRLRSPIGWV